MPQGEDQMDLSEFEEPEVRSDREEEVVAATAPRVAEDGETEVTFKFPKGVDGKVIREAMDAVGKMTENRLKALNSMDESKAEYQRNGHRRFRCQVDSARPGHDYFELTYPHPVTDKPVRVQGRCGVILEEGLTRYCIERLKEAHSWRTEEVEPDPTKSLALSSRQVKVYHYRVEEFGEIENPQEPGSVNKDRKVSVGA